MSILNYLLLGLIFCLAPAGVLWLCRRFPLLDKIGPIMLLYGLGILLGNVGWHPAEMPVAQEIATSATIPLAIPMMLFACRFTLGEPATACLHKWLLVSIFSCCRGIRAIWQASVRGRRDRRYYVGNVHRRYGQCRSPSVDIQG